MHNTLLGRIMIYCAHLSWPSLHRGAHRIHNPSSYWWLGQCCFDAGPASTTLAQHQNSIIPTFRVCWDAKESCICDPGSEAVYRMAGSFYSCYCKSFDNWSEICRVGGYK